MIRKILVPLDGSRESEAALPLVAYLAQAGSCELTLLAVWEAGPEDVESLGPRRAADLREHGMGNMRSYLNSLARKLQEERALTPATEVRAGHPAIEIMNAATERGSDLIAMSTHGRRAVSAARRGSVADKVLRSSAVPVLAVGPLTLRGVAPTQIRISQILVPLDGATDSEAALPFAAELARGLGARIHLLRVVTPLLSDYGTGLPDWYAPEVDRPQAAGGRTLPVAAADAVRTLCRRVARVYRKTGQ